jgi:hypothetical protein
MSFATLRLVWKARIQGAPVPSFARPKLIAADQEV